ncbi:MAG: 3'-5' exonuclease [Candidatus Margulisbacteria bacterium]|jgi:DNA polymerase III epsilon subunit family exonuclease|nr:3'-5' exonuclease [Candidatus Margulisiibacteriota bacterium]
MFSFTQSEEFVKLESEYPFLRRAREQVFGLRSLPFVIVDIETTGLEPADNEITEVAALKLDKGEIIDVFGSLIRVNRKLPPEIIKLTGITDELLREEGKNRNQVLRALYDFIGKTPLIAHNVEFDLPFINHHLKKDWGITLQSPPVCTLKLSRKLLPGLSSHRLGEIAKYFKVPVSQAHRAAGDVETTHQVWNKLVELLEKNNINTLETLLKYAV